MTGHEIEMACTVAIVPSEAAPADWLTRVTTDDFPYRRWETSTETRPLTEREGLEHLAYNAVSNGVDDASRLDGWGDLDPGMVRLEVHNAEASP